jgi:hypothetical protein
MLTLATREPCNGLYVALAVYGLPAHAILPQEVVTSLKLAAGTR